MPLPSEMLRRMLAGDRDSARELGRWLDTLQGARGGLDTIIGAISGRVLVDSLIYGSMWAEDIAQTVAVATAHVYYAVGGGLQTGTCNGLTFQNARELRAQVAGRYAATWSMSLSNSASDQTIEGLVMVNAAGQEHTSNATRAKENGVVYSVGGGGVVTLVPGDVVKLAVENENGASTITINHANLMLVRVGA
ncbi:MAG: hypothetical protein IPK44_01615 [Candidatus Accumulibacter sp.]|uniref:hypothetical protein n=1 Tax=Accumulibacter sp. TaxID=2053492 RepID=UPI00258A5317|nr:hypothetical protein [Accumulibacter sp.]MBK8113298.1 hypothetical protein [Accumulibacter sp.]